MHPLPGLIAISILIVIMLSAPATAAGTGIKVFTPTESSIATEQLPLHYDGAFIVENDGLLPGVYVMRVAVDYPAAITWVNVTPSGFALAPGETRMVNFSINIADGEAAPGTYQFVFLPTLLPRNVEPYPDTFANYVSETDRFNFTVDLTGYPEMTYEASESAGTPVTFAETENPSRVNLVQFVSPESEKRVVTQIDRFIRINVPSDATIGEPVDVSVSVFEDLSSRGIDLMAVSPDGIFYPVEGDKVTFDRTGHWGIIALIGDVVLLGKPVEVSEGGIKLVMPGIGTILAAISLLLLLALVPIWLTSRSRMPVRVDPYDEVAYKAYVIKKYMEKFDATRLRNATDQLKDEYYDLLASDVKGNRKKARVAVEELEVLAGIESPSDS